jgi:hypothetical protein
MKFLKAGILAFITIATVSTSAQGFVAEEISGKELLQEFNYNNPELSSLDNFTKMISQDKSTGTKVFFSKNMPSLDFNSAAKGGAITPQFAVECSEGEDEICTTTTTTTTKNGRIIKQSCECS